MSRSSAHARLSQVFVSQSLIRLLAVVDVLSGLVCAGLDAPADIAKVKPCATPPTIQSPKGSR
jgi:hypothetical protein